MPKLLAAVTLGLLLAAVAVGLFVSGVVAQGEHSAPPPAVVQNVPPLPDWVAEIAVRFSPDQTAEELQPPEDLTYSRQVRDLVKTPVGRIAAQATEALAGLDSADPEEREKACKRIDSLAHHTALPDMVERLSRTALSDAYCAAGASKGGWPWPDSDPRVPHRFPVREAARQALRAVWDRADLDSRLSGLTRDDQIKLLGATLGRPGSEVAETELMRMGPDAVADAIHSREAGKFEVHSNQKRLVYGRSHEAANSRERAARLLGILGGRRSVQALKELLRDPACHLESRSQPGQAFDSNWEDQMRAEGPSAFALVYGVRNAAARALVQLGYKVRIIGHEFVATR